MLPRKRKGDRETERGQASLSLLSRDKGACPLSIRVPFPFGTQALVLLQEVLTGRAGALGLGQDLLDLVGMVVDGLSATGTLPRLAADRAVSAKKDGRRVAEAAQQG
jgi:hypothetical protein